MSEAGRELFNQYILEILSSQEKHNATTEAHVREMWVRATSAAIRLRDIEDEVGELHKAFAEQILRKKCDNSQRSSETDQPEV